MPVALLAAGWANSARGACQAFDLITSLCVIEIAIFSCSTSLCRMRVVLNLRFTFNCRVVLW
jgi:hypothetical protein